MCATEFRKIIVIGYGMITEKVLKIVYDKSKEYGYSVEYIEHEVHPFNGAKRLSEMYGINYRLLEDKTELKEHLLEAAQQRMLIISASNNYIFPKLLVENQNVTIINFHNALLPDYPGRNAPSWVIYSGESKTGITWHYVTGGVDEGDIIIQKQCPVQPQVRAYELAATLMKLAAEAFEECYLDVLCGRVNAKRQENTASRRVYKSYEVPGDGRFDMTDSPQYIYRLLRAMDYGKNDIFPLAKTELNGNTIQIRRYRLIDWEEKKDDTYRLYIPYGEGKLLMLRYEAVSHDGLGGGSG